MIEPKKQANFSSANLLITVSYGLFIAKKNKFLSFFKNPVISHEIGIQKVKYN